MTHAPARSYYHKSQKGPRFGLFSLRQIDAHAAAQSIKQRKNLSGPRPRRLKGTQWVPMSRVSKVKQPDKLSQYVSGVAAKLVRRSIDRYTAGFKPTYWRTIDVSFVTSVGFNIFQFQKAVAKEVRRQLNRSGSQGHVTINGHPWNDTLVIHLSITQGK